MTFQKRLSFEQEAELVLDYKAGWTVQECTVGYKVSERTVYRILSRAGVLKNRRRYANGRIVPLRRKKKKKKELKPCGTDAAYQRHKHNKEYPCTECLAAHALETKLYKERKKNAQKAE